MNVLSHLKLWFRTMRVALAVVAIGENREAIDELTIYLRWVRDGKPDLIDWVQRNY